MTRKSIEKLALEAANTALRLIKKRLTIDEQRQNKIRRLIALAESGEIGAAEKKRLSELISAQISSKELLSYAETLTELSGEKDEQTDLEIKLSDAEGLSL